jgi:zinc protease
MSSHSGRADALRVVRRDVAPEPGPLRPFDFPRIHRHTLSNGMPVVLSEVHNLPVVTMSVILRAGATTEDASRAGVASLAASLLESGAGSLGAAEIAEAIETMGVRLGAGASWDAAHLDMTCLRSRLEPASDVFADLARQPTFPAPEVERLRAERLAEIAQLRADPRSLAGEMFAHFVYSSESPFSRPLAGTADSVARLTRQDVATFHALRYTPASAALVISGDVTAQQAFQLAEERFGDWAGNAPPIVTPADEPRAGGPRIVIVDRPGSVQAEVRAGHVGVSRDTADYFSLIVMNTILGGAFSSRLNLSLRERHGYTYGVSSGFAMRRQRGPFVVSTAVQSEVTAAAVREILHQVRTIREEEVTPRELDDARNYLAGVFPLRLQTTDGIAARLAELVVHDLPDEYLDEYRERVLGVTAADVLQAARDYLHPDEATVVIVADAAAIRGSLEDAELGPVEVVSRASVDSEE